MGRNGEKYEGMFVNNKLHGQGTLTYANGDKYIGSWNSNKFHGQGSYTFYNGAKSHQYKHH